MALFLFDTCKKCDNFEIEMKSGNERTKAENGQEE